MTISVRLGDEMESRLSDLASMTGRTISYYIREAVLEKLEDLEDIYIAEKRLEKPSGVRWSLKDIRNKKDILN